MPTGIYERRTLNKQDFIKRINKTETCWLWDGSINKVKGYGNWKRQTAHRASYEYFKGPIPKDMLVCHTCDMRSCVNPEHLFLGTAQDNTDDMMAKGRNRALAGEDHPVASLSNEQAKEIRAKYIPWKMSCSMLAKEYKVHKSTIKAIIANRTYNIN